MSNNILHHNPSPRPFDDPPQKIRKGISLSSLDDPVRIVQKPKEATKPFRFPSILSLFIFFPIVFAAFHFSFINPSLSFDEDDRDNFPLKYFFNDVIFSLIPDDYSFIIHISATSILLYFYFATISQTSNQILAIFLTFSILTDVPIISELTSSTPSALEIIFLALIILSLSKMNQTEISFNVWSFWLFLSVFVASISTAMRIENIILFIPIIISVISETVHRFYVIFIFIFTMLLNLAVLLLIDRTIRLPNISLDLISSKELFSHCLNDCNGLFVWTLIIIPVLCFFTQFSVNEHIFLFELLLTIVLLFKIPISSYKETYCPRTLMIRFISYICVGKILCQQKSGIVGYIFASLVCVTVLVFQLFGEFVLPFYQNMLHSIFFWI
ncbi:hypothetical protein TRFO_36283 [Tritrichomonas foetus]|uniref:Uncharacterized protein n=1 Tax=Tritrichomonas foetus TaxID=1144522 RepID=A0A1J4JIY6_9EUKA|nr:hypothetical protein TRFO_36283 [Tritrichomonas foetus]|eukprot:OHS97523.1 hypothetical protein TRFO_36283 [Tritrichomonas foetus]